MTRQYSCMAQGKTICEKLSFRSTGFLSSSLPLSVLHHIKRLRKRSYDENWLTGPHVSNVLFLLLKMDYILKSLTCLVVIKFNRGSGGPRSSAMNVERTMGKPMSLLYLYTRASWTDFYVLFWKFLYSSFFSQGIYCFLFLVFLFEIFYSICLVCFSVINFSCEKNKIFYTILPHVSRSTEVIKSCHFLFWSCLLPRLPNAAGVSLWSFHLYGQIRNKWFTKGVFASWIISTSAMSHVLSPKGQGGKCMVFSFLKGYIPFVAC